MWEYIKEEYIKPLLDAYAEKTGCRLLPDRLLHPRRENVCTLQVPGYRQMESYTCGFVAALIVLHTFRPKMSIARFFHLVGPDEEYGTQTSSIVKSLRASGIGVSQRHDLDFDQICRAIDSGYPIITLVKSADPDIVHWVVIYGRERKPNRVFIAGDGLPLIGRKEALWSEFSRSKWAERGFGLVCWGK